MENERCKITLDSPTNTYRSGQTINGTITLHSNKGKKIRGIFFQITGYGKCGWKILIQRPPPKPKGTCAPPEPLKTESDRAMNYSGSEEYLNSIVYLVGSKTGPAFEISAGSNTYPFSFQLKHQLPSSIKGAYGKIKYKMEFVVDRPWKFDEKYEVPLNIYKSLDLNFDPFARIPQQKQLTRNIGFFGSGPISLHVLIPRSGCCVGEKLPLQVVVSNNSSTDVEKVKFTVLKVIEYHSTKPSHQIKQETVKVMKKEAGGVERKSEQRYEHNLEIPELQSTDSDISAIIKVKYEIRVEAKLSGFLTTNLVETVPLTVATVPLRELSDPAAGISLDMSSLQINPGGVPAVSMPMPMPTASIGYPTLPPVVPYPPPQNTSTLPYPPSAQSTPLPPPRHSHHEGGTNTPFQSNLPSAPPLDFSSVPNTPRSSIGSQQWGDTPPSYDQVFGSPAHSIASSNRSMTHLNEGTDGTKTGAPAVAT